MHLYIYPVQLQVRVRRANWSVMETALVSASQSAVRILLGKLGNVLATKYALLSGVRGQIQELKDELESMTGCLRDLADRNDHSQQTRIWMKQVREVAFDAEDCIDKFCRHLGQHPGDDPGLASYLARIISLLRTMGLRAKLAAEITRLQSRAKGVSDRRIRYRLEDAAGADPSSSLDSSSYNLRRWLPSELGGGSGLVGMDDRTHRVVHLLEDGAPPRRRVVSIVGSGGLGKTTLATAVYNSPELRDIQCRAFVAVSQTYDLRSLLESMLKQLVVVPAQTTDDDHPLREIKSWDITEFPRKYTELLRDKRYLIVLDDVWMPAAWEDLNMFFPENGKKSIIIVTTRSHHVARNYSASSSDHIYMMEPLKREDSEQLFFRTAFESEQCLSGLREVSTAILKKCSNLPLAIVSIGRMLALRENKTPKDWQKVCDRLGPELDTNPTLEAMSRILTLSYNDLPYNLKACFLYLCAFPEDYEIKRGPLIRRWAAEGFIAGIRGLSLEQIGQNYFDEFISRSLVTPGVISDTGEVKSCKIHDIMLEVITSKSVHENFVSFLGSCEENIRAGHDKIRRLSIHPGGTSRENRGFTGQYLTHTRSLTIIDSTTKPAAITFSGLTLLRVLDLEGCSWLSNQDLKDICKLSLLVYLSLRNTTISEVPNAVGKLKELVTLDVRETSVTEFPKGITKLQNLKHLMTGSYQYYTRTRSVKHLLTGVRLPRGLRNMCALQRISTIDINKSFRSMDELGGLSQLTRLYVVSHEADEDTSSWQPFVGSLNKLSSSLRYMSFQRLRSPPVVTRANDGGQPPDVLASQISSPVDTTPSDRGEPLNFLADLKSPPLFLQSLHLCGRPGTLPPWFSSLSDLASVSIRETCFGAELIKVLGELPNLLSFKIYASGIESTETRLCFGKDQFPRLKQLVLDNPSNFSEEISFCGGATNLERLTLSIVRVPNRGISGIEKLLKLREVEFFGSIVNSLVVKVMAAARKHPNCPRVTLEGQPTYDQSTEAQPIEAQPTEAQPMEAQPTEAQPTYGNCLSILLAAWQVHF